MRLILFFITLLLANTVALAKPPDWVNSQSNRYPAGFYLVGVGQADSREGAKEDALASIAKIFRVQIEQQTSDWEKYIQIESRGKTQIEQKKSIESLTHVSTDKVIEGVVIVETAQDGAVYYALAMMDRLQATAKLSERIADLDQRVKASLALAQQSPEKLSRIKNYKYAIKTLLMRDATNTELQIVNVKGSGIPSPVSITEVVQAYDEWLAKNFLIDVEVSGAQGAVVEEAITASLLREGFPVNGDDEDVDSDLLVKGDVTLTPIELQGQSFKYVRWCVDLTILETKGNRIVGVITKSGREGHLSASEAESRAIRALQPAVITDIGERIAEYFTGEFQPVRNRSSGCGR